MAQESLRSVRNYDDVPLLGPTDIWSSLGYFIIHPFSEMQQTSKVRVMLSLSCLLFIGLPFSAPSHGSNYGRERRSSSFPTPDIRIKLSIALFRHCRKVFPEKEKRGMPSTANRREEENFNPFSFSIKFWIVVLLPSFDSAFIYF